MSASATPLSHRLARDPSPMADVRSAAIYAIVPVFMTVVAWLTFSGTLAPGPNQQAGAWAWAVLAILGVFSLAFVARLAGTLKRAMNGRIPIIEVDAQPWQPGAASRIRIVDPDTGSLDGLEVVLIADGVNVERVPLTTASDGGWRISAAVRHQLPLLTLKRAEFQDRSVDRVVPVTVPREAANQDWRWRVVVLGRKDKVRVPVREDSYPVRIDAGRPEHPIRV